MTITNNLGMQVGKVLRAPKTAELIATHLRRQIVRGELTPGQSLPSEVQLMEQFGVSRPTMREAFRILETETLINVRRGSRGGAQVMAPDNSVAARYVGLLLQLQGTTIGDVYEARMIAEPACARLLAKNRTDEDLADLREITEALKVEISTKDNFVPDPDKWSALTYRFHELILQRSGNKTLAVQGAVLQDIVMTHLHLRIVQGSSEDDTPQRFRRAVRSYEKLIRLVEARDGDAAENHWRSHMQVAARYMLKGDLKDNSVVDLFG